MKEKRSLDLIGVLYHLQIHPKEVFMYFRFHRLLDF
jgi:hypothetical protein